jgi:hypothetical protein
LGSLIESKVKSDPTIRLLVSKLSTKIPKLAEKISQGQEFISKGSGGQFRGKFKGGEFETRSFSKEDGSLIQPTRLAAKSIRKMLENNKNSESEISDALSRLELAKENVKIDIGDEIEAVKWSIDEIHPTLDGEIMNPVVALKSAYEFLALHLNSTVYESTPSLEAVRNALSGEAIDLNNLAVDRLHAPDAKPFHGLCFEGNSPYAKVQVRFFGQLAYRVHFKTLSIGGPRFMYTHDLEKNTEHVSHNEKNDNVG